MGPKEDNKRKEKEKKKKESRTVAFENNNNNNNNRGSLGMKVTRANCVFLSLRGVVVVVSPLLISRFVTSYHLLILS